MKLTIILTVYNKEQFLCRCIDSCLGQQDVCSTDYELIIVNDGSTDGSLSIIWEYAAKYSNIKFLDQPNAGLSVARNNGVKACTGDYIWFVDADDCIASDSVKHIFAATSTNPDVIPIYAVTYGVDNVRNSIPINVRTGRDVLLSKQWQHCAPFYVIRRTFWKDECLRFFPGIYHEDNEFTPRMLYKAKSVSVVRNVLYIVYCDLQSITHVPRIKRSYDMLIILERLSKFVAENDMDTILRKVFDNDMSVLLNSSLNNIVNFESKETKKFNLAMYGYRKYFICLKNAKAKNYLEYYLFRLFPKHYVGVYKAMKFYHLRTMLKH